MGAGLVNTVAAASGQSLSAQLVDSHWYRVADLAPRLREGLRMHPQRYRGQLWYVIEDRINGKYHRFDAPAYRLIRLFDGSATLDQLWLRLAAQPGEHLPSQQELLALLGRLHALDLLAGDAVPDLGELAEREAQQSRQRWRQRWLNPLALRVPLVDPDRWLAPLADALRPLAGRAGALLWLAWVLPALALAAMHGRELTHNFGEQLLAFDNLLLLALLYPLVKLLHELGHGIACKLHGGEVHDMGVMLLLFLPVPYVEASSAWTFADRRARMLVGAAGILVELAIAAGAFYLWLLLEPGLLRALAYNVAVLASVSTVLFNGNPLLRYDGYYVASDALEIPNLASRANQFWRYLVERHLLKRERAVSPASSAGEARWLCAYAPLSFAYRLLVMFSIAAFVAQQYFVAGMLLAVWSLVGGLGLPLYRSLGWLQRVVWRVEAGAQARRIVLALAASLALLLFALPLPYRSQADGVLWLPEKALLRAPQSGFVAQLVARPGTLLEPGAPVLQLAEPALERELEVQLAREDAAQARLDAALVDEPARLEQYRLELAREQSASAYQRQRARRLELHAGARGRLWLDQAEDLQGRWVREGQLLGQLTSEEQAPRVRVIVDQAQADAIRGRSTEVLVRLPFDVDRVWPARIVQAVPAAGTELPSAALGRQGGGAVPTDPHDDSGRKALVSHFEYELALPDDFPHRLVGSRVAVRFVHAAEPLAPRLWRAARRQLLALFRS
jgi:putative peptide zinc metalloprotease protein